MYLKVQFVRNKFNECLTKIIFDISGIGTNTDILTGIGTPSKDSGSLGDTVNIRT